MSQASKGEGHAYRDARRKGGRMARRPGDAGRQADGQRPCIHLDAPRFGSQRKGAHKALQHLPVVRGELMAQVQETVGSGSSLGRGRRVPCRLAGGARRGAVQRR